jgi:hypothetical protein
VSGIARVGLGHAIFRVSDRSNAQKNSSDQALRVPIRRFGIRCRTWFRRKANLHGPKGFRMGSSRIAPGELLAYGGW